MKKSKFIAVSFCVLVVFLFFITKFEEKNQRHITKKDLVTKREINVEIKEVEPKIKFKLESINKPKIKVKKTLKDKNLTNSLFFTKASVEIDDHFTNIDKDTAAINFQKSDIDSEENYAHCLSFIKVSYHSSNSSEFLKRRVFALRFFELSRYSNIDDMENIISSIFKNAKTEKNKLFRQNYKLDLYELGQIIFKLSPEYEFPRDFSNSDQELLASLKIGFKKGEA